MRASQFIVAAHGYGNIQIDPDEDQISLKLAALHFYQLANPAPTPPPPGSSTISGKCGSKRRMPVELNGIAHIQLTVANPAQGLPFWEKLCGFLAMQTLIKGDDVLYCIGSRTGVLVRGAPHDKRDRRFDQDRPGLHHFCFRARARDDVDQVYRFAVDELQAKIVHPPEEGAHFAPGYYSVLFEDPDGIRIEINHVPGKGHFGPGGRLGPGGDGPATTYGDEGLGSTSFSSGSRRSPG